MDRQPCPQTIEQALEWHFAISLSASVHRISTLEALRLGKIGNPRFFGMAIDDIDDAFAKEQVEISSMTSVNIVAAAEAAIRADYRNRIARKSKRKDLVSTNYRLLHRKLRNKKRSRPALDENGILEHLKSSGGIDRHLVTNFRHVLKLRHWYAHGRYWLLRSNAAHHSPIEVHQTCADLLRALPA